MTKIEQRSSWQAAMGGVVALSAAAAVSRLSRKVLTVATFGGFGAAFYSVVKEGRERRRPLTVWLIRGSAISLIAVNFRKFTDLVVSPWKNSYSLIIESALFTGMALPLGIHSLAFAADLALQRDYAVDVERRLGEAVYFALRNHTKNGVRRELGLRLGGIRWKLERGGRFDLNTRHDMYAFPTKGHWLLAIREHLEDDLLDEDQLVSLIGDSLGHWLTEEEWRGLLGTEREKLLAVARDRVILEALDREFTDIKSHFSESWRDYFESLSEESGYEAISRARRLETWIAGLRGEVSRCKPFQGIPGGEILEARIAEREEWLEWAKMPEEGASWSHNLEQWCERLKPAEDEAAAPDGLEAMGYLSRELKLSYERQREALGFDKLEAELMGQRLVEIGLGTGRLVQQKAFSDADSAFRWIRGKCADLPEVQVVVEESTGPVTFPEGRQVVSSELEQRVLSAARSAYLKLRIAFYGCFVAKAMVFQWRWVVVGLAAGSADLFEEWRQGEAFRQHRLAAATLADLRSRDGDLGVAERRFVAQTPYKVLTTLFAGTLFVRFALHQLFPLSPRSRMVQMLAMLISNDYSGFGRLTAFLIGASLSRRARARSISASVDRVRTVLQGEELDLTPEEEEARQLVVEAITAPREP